MLVALQADQRVAVWDTQKGPLFVFPKCRNHVILKTGRLVAHQFGHKPPVTCPWAAGETQGHLSAKVPLLATFTVRRLNCTVEREVLPIDGYSGGDDESAAGYLKQSKRWRELYLEGAYPPDQVWLNLFSRKAYSIREYAIPTGPAAGMTKLS